MNLFYQAPNARTGDVIPKYLGGTYQLFYLKGWKDRNDPAFTPGWHRMESRAFYAAKTAGHDLVRYLFGWIPTKEENIFGF